jgi:hypothetical protein
MPLLGNKHWIALTLPSQCTDYSIVQMNESNICDKQLLGAQQRKFMYKGIKSGKKFIVLTIHYVIVYDELQYKQTGTSSVCIGEVMNAESEGKK